MAEKTRLHVPINNVLTVVHPETEIDQILGLARQNSTAYSYGAVVFAGSLPLGIVLKCTTAGTTAATEPSFSGATVGGTVQDGTVTWTYQSLLNDSIPLGTILPYSANAQTPPYGFFFAEGQAVSRTMYPDLFELIGVTYGEGDGETTFNLPNLIDAAMLNGSYTKTSYTTAGSATFTAPKTGYYKITVKGGGGGGQGGMYSGTSYVIGGRGGGEGGTTIGYEKMTAGQTASIVIGAGGAGGNANGGFGGIGGDSSVTINTTVYTGGGAQMYGQGGNGTILGAPGGAYIADSGAYSTTAHQGGVGGGAGGGANGHGGENGGGGAGGSISANGNTTAGGAGGDGYATFEYIGISMKYMVKSYDAPTPSSAQIDLSQYAADLARRLTREMTPAFNKRDVITVSGTYTAPVTGWYRITVKGGGGGGQGGYYYSPSYSNGGSGGGEGGTSIGYEYMNAGDSASVVIGAGGAGGAAGGSTKAGDGGDTTVTVNSTTYTGGGGKGADIYSVLDAGAGGTGTIQGAAGQTGNFYIYSSATASSPGGSGGGAGGGRGGRSDAHNGTDGGGGSGAVGNNSKAGGNGGDGFVWFEYFDGSLN